MTEAPDFSLGGRNAIVTGGGRGIGRTLAVGLAAAGADVAVIGRTAETLAETAEAIEGRGRRSAAIACDLRRFEAIEEAVARAQAALGTIDILINNAGVEDVRPSLEVDEALWDKIVDTNLKAAFFVARAVARRLVAAGRPGSLVNLCSLTSGVGVPGAAPYTASKSGLLGMTRALAAEWAGHDIRVNAIGPGYFRTALTEVFYRDPAWCDAMLGKIPMRRFGRLDDLVGATVFLSGDAARYITGQLLYIDGGYMASI